jgi:hypothetical protein
MRRFSVEYAHGFQAKAEGKPVYVPVGMDTEVGQQG